MTPSPAMHQAGCCPRGVQRISKRPTPGRARGCQTCSRGASCSAHAPRGCAQTRRLRGGGWKAAWRGVGWLGGRWRSSRQQGAGLQVVVSAGRPHSFVSWAVESPCPKGRLSVAGSRELTRVLLEHLAQLVGVHHILQAHLLALALLGARVGPHAAARRGGQVSCLVCRGQPYHRSGQPSTRHPTHSLQAPNPTPRLTCSTWAAPSGPESERCWCPRS